MKIIIVDDEPLARARLRRLIGEQTHMQVIGEAADTTQAQALLTLQPDVVLLDIAMPGESGLAFAEQLREQPLPPAVIFTTAHPEHALDATQSAPAGYLLKPIERQALITALERACQRTRAQQPSKEATTLSVQIGRETLLIPADAIIAAIAEEKTTHLHFIAPEQPQAPRQAWIETSLKQLEQRFGAQLIRIHRSALIHPRYLTGLTRTTQGQIQAHLHGLDDPLPVSRRMRANLDRYLGT